MTSLRDWKPYSNRTITCYMRYMYIARACYLFTYENIQCIYLHTVKLRLISPLRTQNICDLIILLWWMLQVYIFTFVCVVQVARARDRYTKLFGLYPLPGRDTALETRFPAPLPLEHHGLKILVKVVELRWVGLSCSTCSIVKSFI